jgi:hypothetical protein
MANFVELRKGEVRRITTLRSSQNLPSTRFVNKDGFSSVWQKRAEMLGTPQPSGS